MRLRLLLALAAGLMVGAGEPPPCEELIYGIPEGSQWVETEKGPDGRTIDTKIEFKNGFWWSIATPGGPKAGTPYTLDLRLTPPRIDTAAGRGKGIFRLSGNRLLICIGERVCPAP